MQLKTGRLQEIVKVLKNFYKTDSIAQISLKQKLDFLCQVLHLSSQDLDLIISEHSPVLRTIAGHAFESVFDHILKVNNIDFTEVEGDSNIDKIVNNIT